MKYFDRFHPAKHYHIFNHAVGNEDLFRTPENYLYFLSSCEKYLSSVFIIKAYCLMPNHFHFLVEVRDKDSIFKFAQISREGTFNGHKFIMQKLSNLLNSYAKSYNIRFSRRGALFVDYTRRIELPTESSVMQVMKYIHMNPVRHGFCQSIRAWPYSSYNSFLALELTPNPELDFIFEYFDGIESFVNFHHQL